MRLCALVALTLATLGTAARAQPSDPYGDPAPAPAPAPKKAPAPAKSRPPKKAPAPKDAQPTDPYADAPAPAPAPAPVPAPAPPTTSPGPTTAPGSTTRTPGGPTTAQPGPAGMPAPPPPNLTPPPTTVGPIPPGAPATDAAPADPVLNEQIAASLVARAQELFEQRVFLDAKQLAVESLVRSPRGPSADRARGIVHAVNAQLHIPEEAPPKIVAPPPAPPEADLTPIGDPTLANHPLPPIGGQVDAPAGDAHTAAIVHGGLYTGLIGATIGSFFSDDTASGAVPVGLAFGVAGGVFLPRVFDHFHWTEAQIRTAGSGTVWGGVVGGLIADLAKTEGTSGREVLVGAAIGSTVVGAGATLLARKHTMTRGDVALVDTFAGMGAVGGLTLGLLMQPAEGEAYSLNAALGVGAGVIVGYVAAPKTNTTPRRMLRVAGLSAAGGALPFLLYAAIRDNNSTADERVTGALSTIGVVGGAWLGFYLTRHLDVGLDTLDGKARVDDAPAALIGRSSDGRWALNGLGVSPLSRQLAPQKGLSLTLVGATF